MAPENAVAESGPQGMSEPARVAGVFFEPSKTFADIARRPTWLVPLALWILASVGLSAFYGQRVGWQRMIQHQMETSSQAQQLSPAEKEQRIAMGSKVAPLFAYVGTLIGLPLYCLLAAAIFLGLSAGVMSAPIRFKQAFAVVAYSHLTGIVYAILAAVVMFLKNPDDFDLQNPLMFNVGAFMDAEHGSKFLHSLATSIDLFSFWTMFLMAIGLKAAAGKKLSFGGALFVVLLPWAVYVLIKSALAGAFG